MRLHADIRLKASALLLLLPLATFAQARRSFHVMDNGENSWPAIFSSMGFTKSTDENAGIVITSRNASLTGWNERLERGAILIVEGDSPLAISFGFRASSKPKVSVRSVEDLRAPDLRIVWERPIDVPVFDVPTGARVFAWERRQKAPLMAGVRKGSGAVLWLATPPGSQGLERFPYIPQALADLGLAPPFRSARLWTFFDSAYRSRVDLDYFAARWRSTGISALHIAAWHFWERNPQQDTYLEHLIEACHRNAIQVYAWLELPHVSEKLWEDHPAWREKTALGQDAHLDWRKLVNLLHPEARQEITRGTTDLLTRFDWDGVNLAELYFESLEGVDNPARFTPLNDQVREEFRAPNGFDPRDLFDPQSPRFWSRNPQGLRKFLDYRAALASRLQQDWIGEIENIRRVKPHLDLVLTHIDDRFDTSMNDKLGADTARTLPLLDQHDFTFLIEDPATIWNLGPQRYPQIAARYAPLTSMQEKLGIDINVVERYQDVYPTKQQTGVELFQLVEHAAKAFPRVTLYFESSLSRHDLPWLGSAASTVERAEMINGKLVVESRRGAGVPWTGPALVDGRLWPFTSASTVWLPPGAHVIEAGPSPAPFRIFEFNGDLRSATATDGGAEFAYQSSARAMAVLERKPNKLMIDGAEGAAEMIGNVLLLPKGQHVVTIE